jgi:replication factor C subunit 3/5
VRTHAHALSPTRNPNNTCRAPFPPVSRLTKEDRLPHLLLYGPPGTGKTSTILALSRALYGASNKNMTLELNASDERGIDVVREQIQDFASTKRIFRRAWMRAGGCAWRRAGVKSGKSGALRERVCVSALTRHARVDARRSTGFKLIVLDECDAMTKDAQFALRRGTNAHPRTQRALSR